MVRASATKGLGGRNASIWAPGFVGDPLDPGTGLDPGAYTGSSDLIAERHDAHVDGMYVGP